MRRGESVLVTIVVPIVLLVFFASARVLPKGGRGIDYLLPGTLALAIISTSLVSLGIATAYERYYGVLKRLGATPFPRSGLIAAKMLAVATIEVIQIVLLVGVGAIFFDWAAARFVPAGAARPAAGHAGLFRAGGWYWPATSVPKPLWPEQMDCLCSFC